MSDLQCPATLFVWTATAGVPLEAPGEVLPVGAVYAEPESTGWQAAKELACGLRLEVDPLTDLVVDGHGSQSEVPDGPEAEVRARAVLESIADLHRGETVLICSPTAVASVPQLSAAVRRAVPAAWVRLSIDSDGWLISST